ncbi:MAG: TonB-dependent receptor [Spirochaetaceae bacterium]|nr:TonB-dependent receptor [Spirochaetaceae bacterium]
MIIQSKIEQLLGNKRAVSVKRVFSLLLFFLLFSAEADEVGDEVVRLKSVTVTDTVETTQQMEVITADDIEKRNAPDLATLLEETLDMGITRFGAYGNQTEINMRGFDTERIAVLIDGIPANSPRSGEFDVSQIDLANVERIEVIYGGSDTKYNVSGALGGVINIITVKRQQTGLQAGGSIANTSYMPGSYNRKGAVEGPKYEDLVDMQTLSAFAKYGGKEFSWKLGAFGNRAGNHYLYKDYAGFARRKESNEIWDTGLSGSFVWDMPSDVMLSNDASVYYADKQYPVTGVSEGFAKAKQYTIKDTFSLLAPTVFLDDLWTEGSVSFQHNGTRYGVLSEGSDQNVTAINRWVWEPNAAWTLRAGVDWRFINVDTTEDGKRTGNAGGLYLTGEFKPIKTLTLIASAKGVTDTKQAEIVPKAGVAWKVNDMFTLKNNYFRSFKFPDFDDLYYRSPDELYIGNPKLKPEDGWGCDLMGEFLISDNFSMTSALYYQWTKDSIHWVKQGGRWSPENIGVATFIGGDIRPSFTLPLENKFFTKIKLSASYQYQISWLLNDGLDYADKYRIPYMPMHIIGGSVDLQWKTGSLLVSAHYESLRYADTLNRMELAPYCLVNINYNQDIGAHMTAFAVLRNALNSLYTSFAEYPMPGITLTVGGRVTIN